MEPSLPWILSPIHINVSDPMRDAIDSRCKWENFNVSQWIRRAILNQIIEEEKRLGELLSSCEAKRTYTRDLREYLDISEESFQSWRKGENEIPFEETLAGALQWRDPISGDLYVQTRIRGT